MRLLVTSTAALCLAACGEHHSLVQVNTASRIALYAPGGSKQALLLVGGSVQLRAFAVWVQGDSADLPFAATWESRLPGVVSVDQYGKVTGISSGSTAVVLKSGAFAPDSVIVTVQ